MTKNQKTKFFGISCHKNRKKDIEGQSKEIYTSLVIYRLCVKPLTKQSSLVGFSHVLIVFKYSEENQRVPTFPQQLYAKFRQTMPKKIVKLSNDDFLNFPSHR